MDSGVQRGFTLYELMMAVLVASVVLGLGVPNFVDFVANRRITATANDYVTAVHLARSESVTRHAPVTLCVSPDPLAASPSCNSDGSAANGGYVVWVDADRDAVADGGEDVLLQRVSSNRISVLGDSGFIHFGRNGFVAEIPSVGDSASVVLFCDVRGNVGSAGGLSAARALRVPPTGRPAMLTGVAEIDPLPVDCP